jgi:hypothetical protein
MEPASTSAPHKKLQNEVAGIDSDFGSIYVIPAPTDYVDDVDNGPLPMAPHQLLTFGPQQEKIMIIPDYRVNHVMPGIARKPLIGSDKLVKAQNHQEDANSQAIVADPVIDPSFDTSTLLSVEFKERHQVKPDSPLTALEIFTGAEGAVLLDMFESWDIKSLASFVKFPETHAEGVQILRDAAIFPDLPEFVLKVKALLANPPPISAPSTSDTEPSLSKNDLGASRVYPSKASPTVDVPSEFPLLQVPGMTDSIASTLARYALVSTAHEFVALPTKFPGIYSMLEDTGEIPNLADLLGAASRLCMGTSAVQIRINSSPLANTTYLNHLGEAQKSQVRIKDVSKNSLVGALKSMPQDLANQLANLYPPVTSLQALATFSEVNPREYTYLLREFPELSGLCQEAALLVSITQARR